MYENVITEKFLEILTCDVCLSLLVKPKLLDCLHSFCSECLITLFSKETNNVNTKIKYICCPICQKTSFIESESIEKLVQSLPRNYQLENLCEIMKTHLEIKNKQNETTSQCFKISETKDLKYCKLHSQNAIKYYCKECEDVICRVCEIIEHRGHSFVETSTLDKEQESIMLDYINKNIKNKLTIKKSIEKIKKTLKMLKDCENDLYEEINQTMKVKNVNYN